MFKKLISLCLVVASAALMSCGGSSNTITGPGGGGSTGEVASVQVLSAATTLAKDARLLSLAGFNFGSPVQARRR